MIPRTVHQRSKARARRLRSPLPVYAAVQSLQRGNIDLKVKLICEYLDRVSVLNLR